jgi:hypothetical protein
MMDSDTAQGRDQSPRQPQLVKPAGTLDVLGWTAELEFSTPGSLSFRLWRKMRGGDLLEIGWLEIHYPCDSKPRVQIRSEISLDAMARLATMEHPQRTRVLEQAVIDVLRQCGISADETYMAVFFSCESEPLIVAFGESDDDEAWVCWS